MKERIAAPNILTYLFGSNFSNFLKISLKLYAENAARCLGLTALSTR